MAWVGEQGGRQASSDPGALERQIAVSEEFITITLIKRERIKKA